MRIAYIGLYGFKELDQSRVVRLAMRHKVLAVVRIHDNIVVSDNYQETIYKSPHKLAVARMVMGLLNQFHPDVIHINGLPRTMMLFFVPLVKSFPSIVEIHDIKVHAGEWAPGFNVLQSRLARAARAVVVHGPSLCQTAAWQFGVPVEKVKSIFMEIHGAEEMVNSRIVYDVEEREWILFFGRIATYKGLDLLLNAFERARRRDGDLRLLVAGTIVDKNMARLYAQKKTVPGITWKIGRISSQDASYYFSKAKFTVMPYREISQSGVVGTAFAMGSPVLCTSVGGLPDIVHHLKNGWVVPPNANALEDAIVRMWGNPDLLRRLERGTHYTVSTKLSVSAIDREWDALYAKVMR